MAVDGEVKRTPSTSQWKIFDFGDLFYNVSVHNIAIYLLGVGMPTHGCKITYRSMYANFALLGMTRCWRSGSAPVSDAGGRGFKSRTP
jgi:hypothetical protein